MERSLSTTILGEYRKNSRKKSGAGSLGKNVKRNFTTWGRHGKIHENPGKARKKFAKLPRSRQNFS